MKNINIILVIVISLSGLLTSAGPTCRSSLKNCPNNSSNISATLSSANAIFSAESCFVSVSSLKAACNYLGPVQAAYFIDGQLKQISVFPANQVSQTAALSSPPQKKLCQVNTSCTGSQYWCSNGDIGTRSKCTTSGIDCYCSGGKWIGY